MRQMHHPTCIGALIMGIAFNITLSLFGMAGMQVADALYLAAIVVILFFSATVHLLLRRNRKDGG
ncbi:MAG: hypothetical protein K8L91_03940 [Anaerolineae bacterium]|nr:hypothetical protein [Anaerolineae bacterium]